MPTFTPATSTSLSGASPADSPKYAEYVVPLPKNGSWSEKYVVAVTSTISTSATAPTAAWLRSFSGFTDHTFPRAACRGSG